jgi:hypothetical protein
MLLTIAFIVFAMVTLAALEIMLFWQLGARDCRRSSSQRLLGPRSDRPAGEASDLVTVPHRETNVPPDPRARWPPRIRAAAAAIAVAASLGACGSASKAGARRRDRCSPAGGGPVHRCIRAHPRTCNEGSPLSSAHT